MPLPSRPANLPLVRRFEAAGFRAWPSASSYFDGAWAVRLTPGNPARRLNSVNPLDPDDARDFAIRMERVARRFDAASQPLTFRLSPLAGRRLPAYLNGLGWAPRSESLVMVLSLDDSSLDQALDQIPLRDVARFAAAATGVKGRDDPKARAALESVIERIPAEPGLFVLEQQEEPLATAVCVHDGDLAGLFEIATAAGLRGRGYGRRIVLSALKWARLRGAQTAWLQVEAGNDAALALYRSIGFRDLYAYHYRQSDEARP